jgi:hypothetical protein
VTAEPPLLVGVPHDRVAVVVVLMTALISLTASGTTGATMAVEAVDAAEAPIPLIAVTVKVYETPEVSPAIEAIRDVPATVTVTPVDGVAATE